MTNFSGERHNHESIVIAQKRRFWSRPGNAICRYSFINPLTAECNDLKHLEHLLNSLSLPITGLSRVSAESQVWEVGVVGIGSFSAAKSSHDRVKNTEKKKLQLKWLGFKVFQLAILSFQVYPTRPDVPCRLVIRWCSIFQQPPPDLTMQCGKKLYTDSFTSFIFSYPFLSTFALLGWSSLMKLFLLPDELLCMPRQCMDAQCAADECRIGTSWALSNWISLGRIGQGSMSGVN